MIDKPNPSPPWEEQLAACRPEDFDGHTEFEKLTLEQRIEWLDEMIDFAIECRKMRGEI